MKNLNKIFFIVLFFSNSLFAQWDLRASMGLNFTNMPGLRDYLNQNYANSNEQLSAFSSAVEFGVEAGYLINANFQLGLELAYELNSYTFTGFASNFNFDYNLYMPSLSGYYVVPGEGYKLKFGAGVGPRFLMVTQNSGFTNVKQNYSSAGLGFLLKADGCTALSKNLYAYIAGDLRYNFNGKPKDGIGKTITVNAYGDELIMNSLSVGLKLGIAYFF